MKSNPPLGMGKLPSPKENGQKSVGVKPTALQMEQRLTEVEMLLSLGSRRSQVQAAIQAKYKVDWRTVDRYVNRAKANLIKRSGKPKEDHRLDSFNFYQAIVFNASASAGERIRARQRIDELFGLDEPRRSEISGPLGGKIEMEVKSKVEFNHIEFERAQRELFAFHSGNGNGESLHPAGANGEAGRLSGRNGD